MATLTILTLIVEFLPPLLVTFAYLLLFRSGRNRFIEAFIVLMYVKTITFFLFYIEVFTPLYPLADPFVDSNTLYWVLITDFLFQFATTLQEFLTWIMLSFIAVLFGIGGLAVKLTLQDPASMKFRNLITRLTGREPVTDGYSGLRDRTSNIIFDDVEPQPLNPEIQGKAWKESWKDYLIIGLVTIVPSISLYTADWTGADYILGVLIFLTWIYRFGYPASSRIAKSAGLKLGERDLGAEMMRGVLGWFFRLNLLLSIGTIALDAWNVWITGDITVNQLIYNYTIGVTITAPPIIFAIIVLPLAENFSVQLYKRTFEGIIKVRSKVSSISWGSTLKNSFAAIGTGAIAVAALVGAVMGITLSYSWPAANLFPGQVDNGVLGRMTGASNNEALITATLWTLLMLAIPLAIMVMLSVVSHFVRSRTKGGTEVFAILSGLTVAMAAWFLLPGMDYIINFEPTEAIVEGLAFFRLRPIIRIPGITPEILLYRLAYQLVFNVPIFISAVLFILYYFEFRDKWKVESGQEISPLLNIRSRDIADTAILFTLGIVGSIIGVFILSLILPPFVVFDSIWGLITEIGEANGLEFVFSMAVSPFVLIAEHNIVRTLLMLLIGPVFWSLVLWVVAVKSKPGKAHSVALGSLVAVAAGTIVTFLWASMDAAAGVFDPGIGSWVFVAELGMRALVIFGIILAMYILVFLYNSVAGRSNLSWWFPILATIFAIEYFVYDDQFTLIALVILPFIIAGFYKLVYSGRPEVKSQDFLIVYIRFSLMAVAIAEVLSTALWVAGIATLEALFGGNVLHYLIWILPHGIIEIPAFLFAAALSIRIARDLSPSIVKEDWSAIPVKTRELLTSGRTWRTYVLVVFFLLIAALIEQNLTWMIANLIIGG
ncbi:MAG: stage II sporulation protein M [Candidatus Thorarchaeota archaeon]